MSVTAHDLERLQRCIIGRHPCISIATTEESYALDLIHAICQAERMELWCWNAVAGLYPGPSAGSDTIQTTENAAAALYHVTHNAGLGCVVVMLDLAEHMDDPHVRRALRGAIQRFRHRESSLILIDCDPKLPPAVEAEASTVELSLPGEKELDRIVRDTLRLQHRRSSVKVNLTKKQLQTIIRNLSGLTRSQAAQIIVDAVSEDRVFDAEDLNTVLAQKRQHLQRDGVLEYVEAPVNLREIGGLRALKRWLKEREESLSDEAIEYGLVPPRGVLMLGVQGAGKSLCAKAIATAWQRPLLRLDPSVLYDRYIGESERRLRQALRQAERMSPNILWIDEIEKGFASAASHSVDGGLSQRMFGTLLTWMQEHTAPVFLVATANNIEALPPELLRKGRFDEIFFVDLPNKTVRRQIFSIHLKKRDRDPRKFEVDVLADAADGYSGSEIEQAIISAMHSAFAQGNALTTKHIVDALEQSPPLSVTMAEKIHELRAWAKTRCVPTD